VYANAVAMTKFGATNLLLDYSKLFHFLHNGLVIYMSDLYVVLPLHYSYMYMQT